MPTQTEIYGTDPEWVFFGFVCLCDFRFSSLGYSFTVHQADWLSIPRDAPAYPPPPAPEQESQTSVTTREPICCFEDVTQSFNFLPHSAAMPLF